MSAMESEILEYRIPARLRELQLFIDIARSLERSVGSGIELKIGSETIKISDARVLLDAMADGAVMIARQLIQFLGLFEGHDKSPNDLKIIDVGKLSKESPYSAARLVGISNSELKRRFELCIETSNRVSGHFTQSSANSVGADINKLIEAFETIIELIKRAVYNRMKIPFPALVVSSTGTP